MAKKEKYKWRLDPDEPNPPIDSHTKVKHKIIKEYIKDYITVLMVNPRMPQLKLSLVDGFAGGGLYDDSGEVWQGSPFLLLEAVQEIEIELNLERDKKRHVNVHNYFVELNTEYFNCLKSSLTDHGLDQRVGQDIHLYNSDFSLANEEIIKHIKQTNTSERALFLLDQFAYFDVPMPVLKNIFSSLKNAEVLLTFNVDVLTTFIADTPKSKKAMGGIGLAQHIPWDELKKYKQAKSWKPIIQKFLTKGILVESGAKFITLFFIKPEGKSSWSYWFIHLSNVFKANDVMKSLHWKHGNNFAHNLEVEYFTYGYDANTDISLSGQSLLDLGNEHEFDESAKNLCIEKLHNLILEKLLDKDKALTFSEINLALANNSMANSEVTKETIDQLVKSKNVILTNKDGKPTKKSGHRIEDSDILQRNRQLILLSNNSK